jgi:eukaryotic-like serine/threonine-protein kinase
VKHCPECNKNYADPTLSFCLNDGSPLVYGQAVEEPATAILPETGIATGTDAPGESPTRIFDASDPGSAERSQPKTPSQKMFLIVAVLLAIAIGIGGYWYYGRGVTKQIESIAVMPFTNEGGNAEFEYLSDGIAESLIASLSQLPNLNVKARSSVFRYKGKDVNPQTIGKELSVQALLNGRVVQRGQDLILNVELIDVETENVLWTENYARKMSNLVTLQSEIASDLSQKLKTKLSGTDEQKLAKIYTENAEAYRLYLLGKSYWNKRGPKNIEIAIGYYQQAINLDPNFALAFAGLAEAYAQPSQQPTGMTKARAAALKALELDDSLAEAHVAFARVLVDHDYDFSGAAHELRKAIELNPNHGQAHSRYGALLANLGRFDAAEAEYRRSLELEPVSPVINAGFGLMLIRARRYEEAIAQLKKAVELDPNFFLTHSILSDAYQLTGDYAASVEERARSADAAGNPQSGALMRESFAKGGWEGFLRAMTRDGQQREVRINFLIALGEKDQAFAALNEAYEDRSSGIAGIKVNPLFDPLRDDPRFAELLKKVGFPD